MCGSTADWGVSNLVYGLHRIALIRPIEKVQAVVRCVGLPEDLSGVRIATVIIRQFPEVSRPRRMRITKIIGCDEVEKVKREEER
jgi:hypothetical protein